MRTHRYIARFMVEAETPLFVGSGESSLLKDALVQKDNNGFPMINGTSLSGVLRHSFQSDIEVLKLFGESNSNKGTGSLLKVSPANMLLEDSKVSEGLLENVNKELLYRYSNLPSRQHVRISHKGIAEDRGLYDNEVVYKGTRFIFELELIGEGKDRENWNKIVKAVKSPTFRIGSGTRNGYGSLKVISMFERCFNLKNEDLEDYINYNPSFNTNLKFENISEYREVNNSYTKYSLQLVPDSFFIFAEGIGDEEVDNRPLEEEVVVYENGKLKFEKQTVVPASSIKGAISHRVAFHYNKFSKQFADNNEGTIGINNNAVVALFGKAGKNVIEPQAGNVFINDFYFSEDQIDNGKELNHVAIDRFTGGAMDGALFSEKVSSLKHETFNFNVFVNYSEFNQRYKVILDETLKDICKGQLQLGGMTTKGNGVFTGKLFMNDEEIFSYE